MNVIEVSSLWKKFHLTRRPSTLRELVPGLMRRNRQEEFWALKEVSFEVAEGQTFGIIGPNGSGKSTLLKIMTGITNPTRGTVSVYGRICPLIELGAGFHHDLTGRDNVYLNASILGLKRKEIAERFNQIIAFAGLEEFVDVPLKHYSLGMYMRLGFAIVAEADPDILIIDEVLAVGDQKFQQKCLQRIRDFQEQEKTIIFVSHNYELVSQLCDWAIYLERGEAKLSGPASEVVSKVISNVPVT